MYKQLTIPFTPKPFKQMNKTEALEFYNWFLAQKEDRIEALKDLMKEENTGIELDCSLESLVPLWSWYETKIKFITKKKKDWWMFWKRRNRLFPYSSTFKVLSSETYGYGVDIGFYVAEMFFRISNGKLKWGIITNSKTNLDRNMPLVVGFRNHVVIGVMDIATKTLAMESYEENNPKRLYDFFTKWLEYIPED